MPKQLNDFVWMISNRFQPVIQHDQKVQANFAWAFFTVFLSTYIVIFYTN